MFEVLTFAGLVVVGYTAGSYTEKKHLKDLNEREQKFLPLSVRADKIIYGNMSNGQMVMASVVIANDYFKTLAISVKSFIGGNVRTQEMLLDRARREATLRLKAKAAALGAKEIVGFRMDTSLIEQAGVEIFVYGTAVMDGTVHS